MSAPTPPLAGDPPAPTVAEFNELRTRMAVAVAECAKCLTTVADLSEAVPPTAAARRERCDRVYDELNSLSERTGEFHQAYWAAGGGWPADAPTGLTFGAVASQLRRVYFSACELAHTLCELGKSPSARTKAQVADIRRSVRVLEDAAEYLQPGGTWSAFIARPFDAKRENAEHAAGVQAVLEHGILLLDYVFDVDGRAVPITGNSCLVVPGRVPTVCPHANPRVSPTVMGSVQKALLEGVQQHSLNGAVLPDGATLHWIGRVAAGRGSGTCTCHPAAPSAAPAHARLWAGVVTAGAGSVTPAVAATPITHPGRSDAPHVVDHGRRVDVLDDADGDSPPAGAATVDTAGQGVAGVPAVLDAETIRGGQAFAAIAMLSTIGPNVAEIARQVGLSRQMLYRMPSFWTALQHMRAERQRAADRLLGSVHGRDASRTYDPDHE